MMYPVLYYLLAIAAYPYLIYPFFSFLASLFKANKKYPSYYPPVTVLIAAYNEVDCIRQKLDNTFMMEYPSDQLKVVVLTDGSTDGTDLAVRADGRAKLLHDTIRKGKAGAINKAINFIETDIVVCTDANTMLNTEALKELVKFFQEPLIGAVAGEKRVLGISGDHDLSAEGFYWKYESIIRVMDSKAFSVTGAAGELYAIRKELLKPVPDDTICEDLTITMSVLEKGKRVVYEPLAYGTENASQSIQDEWKRKVRIAAGSIQFFERFKLLRFCVKQPFAAFQLISRKLFRWLVVPYVLVVLLPLSIFLFLNTHDPYVLFMVVVQLVFFGWAISGYFLNKRKNQSGIFYFPFYFLLANAAIIMGTFLYLRGRSFVLWEKIKR